MRHAIRCAACLGIAVACERLLEIPHGAWIPMTAAIVLRPDFGGTLRFGLLRVAGTFGGLLLTTLVVHLVLDSVVQSLLLMALLCIAFRLLATVNYGLGVDRKSVGRGTGVIGRVKTGGGGIRKKKKQ